MRARPLLLLATSLLLAGCRPPDPQKDLEVTDFDAYWAVDNSVGATNYLAPAVRFTVRNKGGQNTGSVQATAVFRRQGEEKTWGSDWRQVASAKEPLRPGQQVPVMMKSDARYYSTGAPADFFAHKLFKDARVEVFLREGASGWVKFGALDVERRIGPRGAQETAR